MDTQIFALAGITLALALVGGFIPLFGKIKGEPSQLKMTTGIAAGILLASALMVIIPEGFEIASHGSRFEPLVLGGAILAGFLMMLILEGSGIGHAVHEEHHDHTEEHGHGHVHHQTAPWMLVLGLTLHSAADGLAIGAAASSQVSAITAIVVFAVLVHKIPAAFSLGVFSLHERESRNEAIRDVVFFSLATPIMIIISYYSLGGLDEEIIGLAMLFAAGTFLYVATVDTLPDIHNPETGKKALQHVIIGAAILSLIFFGADAAGWLSHSH